MALAHEMPVKEANRSALNPVLSFVQCCIENPARAARGVASVVSLAAVAILALSGLTGTVTGVGLAIFYAGSCWALALYLRSRERQS